MAEKLGRTVRELELSVDTGELNEWIAFEMLKKEQPNQDKVVESQITNALRGIK